MPENDAILSAGVEADQLDFDSGTGVDSVSQKFQWFALARVLLEHDHPRDRAELETRNASSATSKLHAREIVQQSADEPCSFRCRRTTNQTSTGGVCGAQVEANVVTMQLRIDGALGQTERGRGGRHIAVA